MTLIAKNLKQLLEPEIAAWLGALAPVCALISIGVSIALSPWFSWTNNALSDLGVSPAAPLFNLGLMLTGFLLSIFAIAFIRVERQSSLGLVSGIGLLIVGVSAMFIGVFTEAFIELHIFFGISCFASLLVSTILLGIRFALERGISRSKILTMVIIVFASLSITIGSTSLRPHQPFFSPMEFIELYKHPPPEYWTPEGKVDYLRLGEYIREQVKTQYNIEMPGIAMIEFLLALPILPLYLTLSFRLYRRKDAVPRYIFK